MKSRTLGSPDSYQQYNNPEKRKIKIKIILKKIIYYILNFEIIFKIKQIL